MRRISGAIIVTCFVMAVSGLFFVLILPGCAGGVLTGYQTLTNISKSGEASARAFEEFDRQHQLSIVADGRKAGKTEVQIQDELDSYRKKLEPVVKSFSILAGLIQAGYALLPLVERGVKKQKDLDLWFSDILRASGELVSTLAKLGVRVPESLVPKTDGGAP